MADTGTTTQEGQEPDATDETATGTVETTSTEGEGNQTSEDHQSVSSDPSDPWEGIPEDHWSRKEIESLRRESASRRTENRELKEKLEGAKNAEEVQQIVDEYAAKLNQAELAIAKLNAARKHSLPDDLVDLLKGDTEEELLALAEKLAPYVNKPRTPAPLPPTGGRDPREGSDEETPEQTYAKIQAKKARKI